MKRFPVRRKVKAPFMSFRKHLLRGGFLELPHMAIPWFGMRLLHLLGSWRSQPRGGCVAKAARVFGNVCGRDCKQCGYQNEKGVFPRLPASKGRKQKRNKTRYNLELGNFSSKLHYPLRAARKPLASFQGIVTTCVHENRNPSNSGG